MKKLIEDMLKYSKTRNMDNLPEGYCVENEDIDSFTVMVIDILAWLKLGYKRELRKKERKCVKHRPLHINLKYTWCRVLKDVTENGSRFSKYFFFKDKDFDFRETVPEQDRIEAMKLVYDSFKSERIT